MVNSFLSLISSPNYALIEQLGCVPIIRIFRIIIVAAKQVAEPIAVYRLQPKSPKLGATVKS